MSKNTLEYFMWGYQELFAHSMGYRASEALAALGVRSDVKGLLVGVRVPESSGRHDVCFVPENDFNPDTFSYCHTRTEEIFNDHPDHGVLYGDEPSMRDQPENIRRKSIRHAVEEALNSYDKVHSTVSFCGFPVRVNGYHVVPALLVPKDVLQRLPCLQVPIVFQEWTSKTSIVEALLYRILAEASEGLGKKDPGRFQDEFRSDTPGLLRQAADDFCNAIMLETRDFLFQGIFKSLNEISALKYEGAHAAGSIVFTPLNTSAIHLQITFLKPIPLASDRLARKLVEVSGDDLACVCTGSNGICGLAAVPLDSAEPIFRVVFTGHFRWELFYGATRLMECAYGVPFIPSAKLVENTFISNARRVIPGLKERQARIIWEAVSVAMQQEHGTMLVVSKHAASEVERLQNQGIAVQPISLGPELVQRISGIDGAILIDLDCQCHAIGLILDGLANKSGDPSRGARFNSAVRYVGSAKGDTLCIVVSEDGYIDMIPTLRPQVSRSEMEHHVNHLCSLTFEDYHQTRNWLDRHRFYLTLEQCETVNAELTRIHAEPQEVGTIQIVTRPFIPNPEMKESYYIDSDADTS